MDNGVDDLIVSLYQMDLDRSLFLLRSYLRIRLQKVITASDIHENLQQNILFKRLSKEKQIQIEKYMIHISKTDLWNKLSEQEQKFTKR